MGSVGALGLAPVAYGGLPAQLGFLGLALFWIVTGALAFASIRRRRIPQHLRWMIRSYALTFAAVTLRLWLPLLQLAGLSFVAAYATVAWLSWVPKPAGLRGVLAE